MTSIGMPKSETRMTNKAVDSKQKANIERILGWKTEDG